MSVPLIDDNLDVAGRTKLPNSYRLSEEARNLIVRLAEHLGLSQANVIEMAVRQLARREGIKAKKK